MALSDLSTADALQRAPAVGVSGPALAEAPPAAAPAAPAAPTVCATEVALMLLADVAPGSRAWGWWRIVRGAQSFRRVPGLRFVKVLGSGHEGGFSLRPSASRQGLFLVFDDVAHADAFLRHSAAMQAYRRHASELCIVKLRAWSSRGRWSGQALAECLPPPEAHAPVAALTRASIHPRHALAFWRKAPPAQAALSNAPGCLLAVGLGEAPLLRQATFSLWDSVAAMDAYARSGAHLEAIRAAQREGYFSESMFVRFVPVSVHGSWQGTAYGD